MYFIEQRIKVICDQLGMLRFHGGCGIGGWQYKKGQFFRPQEADESGAPWENFDCATMKWYADYDGSDRFEGKFPAYVSDFRGIPGTHYWFRSHVSVPQELDGKTVFLNIGTSTSYGYEGKNPQFLVFVDGEVVQGCDMKHREILLRQKAIGGEELTIDVQAFTGTLHREFTFSASLSVLDNAINKLYYDILIPLQAFPRLGSDSQTLLQLRTVLNDTINLIDMRVPYSEDFYASLAKAQTHITKHLYEELGGWDDVIATCIGHTHIDVAWWWTVAQTREKVVRSFATVLKMMEEYPNYKFMSSQPVLYHFLKERYPELFEKIKARVAEGRWEVEGSTWVEPDCNLTSGESLVRQFLYGKRFFQEEFGKDCKILWLPDVFGYSAALPQIMKQCGVDYFMTTKLSWNQTNKIPNDTFLWRGLDGSEVLTHMITTVSVGQDPKQRFYTAYNGMLHPDAIMGGWERYQNKELNNDILTAYGYGDGGGGPTREMLETSIRMGQGIHGIPKVRQETARTYFEELDARVRNNRRLETWVGELYFEYHRGTYTSMARNKKANRRSEQMLMDLELLSVLTKDVPKEALDRLWRDTVLLNQFHDILPGTSIMEVYEVTKREYEQLREEVTALIGDRLQALAGTGDGLTIFNSLGFERSDIIRLGECAASALQDDDGSIYPVQQTPFGAVTYVKDIPSKGFKTLSLAAAEAKSPFVHDDLSLETPFYRIRLDEQGRFISLFDKEHDRELVKEGCKLNGLRVYEDKPIYFDNWDIDMYYTEKSWPVENLISMQWITDGPVCTGLELRYDFCGSTICQKILFYADSRRIDFETTVDWTLHQHLLKAEFPVDIHTDEATFDIQFGNVKRKLHTNTSWDKARFETCAHKWMDLSEGHYGVSLLNDCKYGHSVKDSTISLTLIKSGVDPNPRADVEKHEFTYALYPHSGTWQQAETVQEGYKLNFPLYAVCGGVGHHSFASVDKSNVILETVKQAESGNGTILRLYECENARTKTVLTVSADYKKAHSVNLLEQIEEALPICDGKVVFTMKPYEIKTILLQ